MTALQVPPCQTFFKINFKLGMDLSPVLPVSGPFFRDIHGCQIQHFQKAVIRRKYRLAFSHFPELAVESFNGICGVNIVGVVTDTVDDNGKNKEAIEKSKLIHEKTKASYPFLMPDKTNFNGRLNGIQAMPETFFVDSNGKRAYAAD